MRYQYTLGYIRGIFVISGFGRGLSVLGADWRLSAFSGHIGFKVRVTGLLRNMCIFLYGLGVGCRLSGV